jgi:hypothetical protein
MSSSIIPNRIHPKPRLLNITMRNSRHPLILPAVNFYPAFLIIRQSQPLVTPRARADGVGVAAAGGRWVHAELAGDVACRAEAEGADVAGDVCRIGAGGGEKVFGAVGEEDDVSAVELFVEIWEKRVSSG